MQRNAKVFSLALILVTCLRDQQVSITRGGQAIQAVGFGGTDVLKKGEHRMADEVELKKGVLTFCDVYMPLQVQFDPVKPRYFMVFYLLKYWFCVTISSKLRSN